VHTPNTVPHIEGRSRSNTYPLVGRLLGQLRAALPEGIALPDDVWARRHYGILALLWLHVIGIICFALFTGHELDHGLAEAAPVAICTVLASLKDLKRRLRSVLASAGLITSSAILVHLSGGYIELHFHFFVMVAVIALYQDWVPFLLTIGYVVIHHGIMGIIDPHSVYNHPDAWANPWKWAAIHGVFILGISAASIISWRLNEAARARTESVLSSAGEGIYGVDLEGTITFTNPAAAAMVAWGGNELIGRSMHDLLYYPDVPATEKGFSLSEEQSEKQNRTPEECPIISTLREGVTCQINSARFRRKDGKSFPVEYVSTPLREHGLIIGAVVTFKDITERLSSEEALRASEQRYRLLLERNFAGVYRTTLAGRILECNNAFVRALGYSSSEELMGTPASDLYFDIADRELYITRLQESGAVSILEMRLRRKDGQAVWVLLNASLTEGDEDNPSVLEGTMIDITERKALEEQLEHQAFHDPLTDLPNRALFRDRLSHALTRNFRNRASMAVLFLDLDNFKVINDSMGHKEGDQLLRLVAQRLQLCLRPADTVARLGGDEFAILLEDIDDLSDATQAAERITEKMKNPFLLEGREVFISSSIGIAMGPHKEASSPQHPTDFLRDSDIAMYEAKNKSRGGYQVFDPDMNRRAWRRLEVESDLRWALERKELRLHYQPIVELATGKIVELEALLRWEHPVHGLCSPADFIPIAEESGLIVPIGEWVLEEACKQARAWQGDHPDYASLTMSVNLSARQFQQPDLPETVARILRKTGLDPVTLKLEITESVALGNAGAVLTTLHALKDLGIRLAIDDFGTGYSALSYLKLYPVDTLKLDRAFINGLGDNPEDTAIVQAVLNVARTLGLSVTAEGIETTGQLLQLRGLSCERGQGYYFARPHTTSRITELLASKKSVLDDIDSVLSTESLFR
jgi:diguanylate cyclase (GGDEF)-like protein/PAS domain S-box-containing protein